ncbi:MAG: hypothetical protein A2W93_06020 [Bacteroidetes bacterium GWF2_43_63]|nr:MAG: hypothetical protein A2W93_06020 [Bacteroidetes bacterium GWF2_43_63]HBG70002.1 methylmalonyl-CoA mutase small subunit [Bacteroidales bacterium]HCB60738.1 methylmalonyl-CoA mutase small subunit [Bacteroidales bacterium]HCY22128.1 methylmalonyl-CoA mutase small subunit [Bacteroidales bacterium]
MSDNKLFSEFPPVTKQAWEQLINEDLKGADYEKKLVWKPLDGFSIQPYYMAEDVKNVLPANHPGQAPYVRGYKASGNEWKIIQQIDSPDAAEANRFASNALQRGANGVSFKLDFSDKQEDLSTLLKDIDLTKSAVHFHSHHSYSILAELLKAEAASKGVQNSALSGSFNFDSFGYYLLKGEYYNSHEDNMNELKCLIENVGKSLPGYKVVNVNGQHFANAGASAVQELGFAIASAHEYLQEMLNKGLKAEDVLPKMRITLSVGPSYFLEMAKFRAARWLWATVAAQYTSNAELQKVTIHGVSSLYNKTLYDLYNNMLRNTTEAMSAALGGADEITILPHDFIVGKESEFGDRIARNVQLLLKEESHFADVADPAAGSYYIESLTQSVAEFAWNQFRMIESAGGFRKAMESGLIKTEIEKTAAKREKDIASRKMVYVGVNNYPNTNEQFAEAAAFVNAPIAEGNSLNIKRGAWSFEQIRMRADKHVAAGNKRPRVTMLQFGNIAMRNARAIFASNFFGMAGYEITTILNDDTIQDGVKKALDEKPGIIVLCSSDDEYPTLGMEYMAALRNSKIPVVMAGSPGDNEGVYREAGIHSFVHMRTAALEALENYHTVLSVQ